MTSLSRKARIAGLLYLTLLTSPLRLIYILASCLWLGMRVRRRTTSPRTKRFSAWALSAIYSPRQWQSFLH